MQQPTPRRHVLPPRARAAVRIAVTAVALGVVVLLLGLLSNILRPQSVIQERSGASVTSPGQADYAAGLSALGSGDTTKAVQLLAKAAASGNTAAAAKLADVKKTSAAASAVTSDTYGAPVADLAALLPASVPGYDLTDPERSAASAILACEPNDAGPKGTVRLTVFTVLDEKSATAAAAWLAAFPKAFPHDLAAVKVGTAAARFGTDDSRSAAIAFVRGRYAFEVVSTATRGTAAAIQPFVLKAAAALAATH